jgi:hypothetical protein
MPPAEWRELAFRGLPHLTPREFGGATRPRNHRDLTPRRSPAGELCFGAIANQLLQFPVLFLQLPPDPLLNRGSGAAGPPARQRDGKTIVHFEKETGKCGIQGISTMVSATACDGPKLAFSGDALCCHGVDYPVRPVHPVHRTRES